MKNRLILLICAIAVFLSSVNVFAVADVEQRVTMNDGIVEVTVRINRSDVYGGNFNLCYDNKKYTFSLYELGEGLQNTLCAVNPNYTENKIRITFAATNPVAAGDIVCFKFNAQSFDENSFLLERVRMFDENGFAIELSYGDDEETTENTSTEEEIPTDEDAPTEAEKKPNKKPSSGGGRVEKEVATEEATEAPTEKATEEDFEVFLLGYDDVKESDWYYESVSFAVQKGIMKGVNEKEFAPKAFLTRAMLTEVLFRMEGAGEASGAHFEDVKENDWYYNSVSWAFEKGIVRGMGENIFAPNANVSREQMAVMLYNYAKYKGYDMSEKADITEFSDDENVSAWAKEQLEWAVGSKLIGGKENMRLDAQGNATRAEVATILKRFIERNNEIAQK